METLKLTANYREDMSKRRMKEIRRQGYVTGSVFGRGADPVSVEVKLDDLLAEVKNSEAGIKSLVDLKINGGPNKSDGMVIVKEFHKDPLSRKVLDIQFQRIDMKQKLQVGVPIELLGEAAGTREGGILDQVMDELQVSCLPTNIPPKIEMDVSEMQLGDVLRVGDVQVGEDIEIIADLDAAIASCRAPSVFVEEVPEEEEIEGEEGAEEEGVEGEAAEEGAEEQSGEE